MVQSPPKAWGRPSDDKSGTYLPNFECEKILRESCQTLGITNYALAKLIGVRSENYSKWFNGSRRPSSKYFAKLSKLHILKAFGLNLKLVDHIDWGRGEIVYKKGVPLGNARGRDLVSQFSGRVQKAKGEVGPHPSNNSAESSG